MEQKAEGKICPECQKPGKFYTAKISFKLKDGTKKYYPYTYPYCNKCRYQKMINPEEYA
jgi:hypothetical protein